MKPATLILSCLCLIFWGCLLGCSFKIEKSQDNASLPPTKYNIDGSFDDWKTYETVKTSVGIDWSNVVITGPLTNEILIKEFQYDNDSNYLYLFFKFEPSIQERWDKAHEPPYLGGHLFFDIDANTNTGSTDFDTENAPQPQGGAAGEAALPGAETRVNIYTGFVGNSWTSYRTVSYEVMQWDSTAKTFINRIVRKEDSREDIPLIEHGKDGVEVALLLTDLQLTKTNRFALTYWDDVIPRENVSREIIQLK